MDLIDKETEKYMKIWRKVMKPFFDKMVREKNG